MQKILPGRLASRLTDRSLAPLAVLFSLVNSHAYKAGSDESESCRSSSGVERRPMTLMALRRPPLCLLSAFANSIAKERHQHFKRARHKHSILGGTHQLNLDIKKLCAFAETRF